MGEESTSSLETGTPPPATTTAVVTTNNDNNETKSTKAAATPPGLAANEGILSTEEVRGVVGLGVWRSVDWAGRSNCLLMCMHLHICTYTARPRHAAAGGGTGPPLRRVRLKDRGWTALDGWV